MINQFLILSSIGLFVALISSVQAGWIRDEQPIMGTTVRAEVWHPDDAVAREAVTAVMHEMHRIDALMSPYKPKSELYRINSDSGEHAVSVGEELRLLIQRSLEISRLTDGAFDITFASVGHFYDYRNKIKPDEAVIIEALPAVDFRHVLIDEEAGTVSFAHAGVKIDLGGIAKGYAVDNSLEILKKRGIQHALISAGGDTGILGNRIDRPWVVAIRDPRHRDTVVAMLPLQDEALSTSGDYERYFEHEGVRYHHILNPITGEPAGQVRSVSILGPNVTTTDALSTSVFVLGVDKGMILIDSLPGIEAIIVDQEGALVYSRGLLNLRTEDSY
jgi:thiamine biosynthesis lipoprotein